MIDNKAKNKKDVKVNTSKKKVSTKEVKTTKESKTPKKEEVVSVEKKPKKNISTKEAKTTKASKIPKKEEVVNEEKNPKKKVSTKEVKTTKASKTPKKEEVASVEKNPKKKVSTKEVKTTKASKTPKKSEITSKIKTTKKLTNIKNKKNIFDIMIFLLTIIFSISMILLCIKYIQINQTKKEIENSVVPKNDSYDDVQEEIEDVKNKYSNEEIIGLLNIDNLNISIPLVKTDDNEYYLNHALDKSKSVIGSTFIDYRHNLDSKQINIYGHNSTRYTTPFKELENYLDQEYYDKHKYFELKIDNEKRIYEIFSIIIANASSKEEHMQFNYEDDDEWLEHFNILKDKSKYDLDVDVSEKDNIVVLQTCLFGKYNGKLLIVVGKEIYAK